MTDLGAFAALELICPRCRRLDEAGRLKTAALHMSGRPAIAGRVAGDALDCGNPHCRARYPIIGGVPVIFGRPGAVTQAQNLPIDLTGTSAEALRALLDGSPDDHAMTTLVARVARYAWAGFCDWSDAPSAPVELVPHARELFGWLRSEGVETNGLQIALGCGLGREAWESSGATILADAHLASVIAAQALVERGTLTLPLPVEAGRWTTMRIQAQGRAPTAAAVCCDILDPPFAAASFDLVVAANVIDSVSSPYMAVGQACALRRTGGWLAMTSPFAWRPHVTQRAEWLSVAAGEVPSEQALLALIAELAPELTLRARRELTWGLWGTVRELVVYRSLSLVYAEGQAPGAGQEPPP